MKYRHVLAAVFNQPWAIIPEKLASMCEVLRVRAAGDEIPAEEIQAHLGAGPKPRANTPGTVAVIPVYGVISRRMNMLSEFSGGTSTEQLAASFRQAMADPSVKAIVLDFDSPGGSVDGVPELAAEIFAARGTKKVIAQVDGMAASAAYWLAAQCAEIVVTPSGAVGSIGVFAEHADYSKQLEDEGTKVTLISAGKYKTDGNPYEPLSDTAKANIQETVDTFYSMFTKDVAKGREVSASDVRNGFGEGRLVLASAAVKQNMADKVATMDETLARFGVSQPVAAKKVGARSLEAMGREIELV